MGNRLLIFLLTLCACKTAKINKEELSVTNAIWKLEKIHSKGKSQNFSTDSIFIYLSFSKAKKNRYVDYRTGNYFIFSTERDSSSIYYFKYPVMGYYDINLADADYFYTDTTSTAINSAYVRLSVTRQERTFHPDLKGNKILKTIFDIAITGRGPDSTRKVKHFIDGDRLTLVNTKSDSIVFLGRKRMKK